MLRTEKKPVIQQRADALVKALANPRLEGRRLTASALAPLLGVWHGHAESKRRRVREAATCAREVLGHPICADDGGYWIARNAAEFAAYQEAIRKGLKFKFVHLRNTKAAVIDRKNEQGKLFDTRERVSVGW